MFGVVFGGCVAIALLQIPILVLCGVEPYFSHIRPPHRMSAGEVLIVACLSGTFLGLLMGGLISLEARQGSRPGIGVSEVILPVGGVVACALAVTTLFAFEAIPHVMLVRYPMRDFGEDWMRAQLAGWSVSFLGFLLVAVWVWRRRLALEKRQPESKI